MSTVLSEEGNEVWVAGNARKAMQVLRPNSSQAMEARQVGRRLYANQTPDDANLIEPVPR